MDNPQLDDDKYMPGIENRLYRYYWYLQAGLNIVNSFRNLILAILGVYIALHLDNWWLLIAMFLPSVLILTVAGYITVHRINKVQEFLGIRFSTHFARQQYNNTQQILDTLREIRDTLSS